MLLLEFVTVCVRGGSAAELRAGHAVFGRHCCRAGLTCVLQARFHLWLCTFSFPGLLPDGADRHSV